MQTIDPEAASRRTAIIVSGMHRSGASAITRVASLLGAAPLNRALDGDTTDERGFDEGRAVVEVNARILDRFGCWWAGWESIDAQDLLSLTRVLERIRRLVREGFAETDLIVLNDPRMCRLLPLWTHALEKEGFRCVHVIALRHPGAVADSLARRDGLSAKAAMLSWLAHSLDADLHSRAQPRVVVSFENLVRDWRFEADRVRRTLAIEWPRSADDVADTVNDLIETDRTPEPPISTPKGPVSAVTSVYDVLRRWSEDDGQRRDGSLFESWRALLEPIRSARSATARISIERNEVIADLEVRQHPVGPLGVETVWRRIECQGHNIEADAAWAWMRREQQHDRAARRAQQEMTQRERSLPKPEHPRGLVSRATRRLDRRRHLPDQAPK